jgi:hypothetical protein
VHFHGFAVYNLDISRSYTPQKKHMELQYLQCKWASAKEYILFLTFDIWGRSSISKRVSWIITPPLGIPKKNLPVFPVHGSICSCPAKTIMKSMDHPNIIKLYETFVPRRRDDFGRGNWGERSLFHSVSICFLLVLFGFHRRREDLSDCIQLHPNASKWQENWWQSSDTCLWDSPNRSRAHAKSMLRHA